MISNLPAALLRPLTEADAPAFAALYAEPAVNHGHPVMAPGETGPELLRRISGLCEVHLGIFLEGELVGDCALHHWDPERREIEIGGALLPGCRGRGIMQQAFRELLNVARTLGAERVLGRTAPENFAAIRLVEGLGFLKVDVLGGELLLSLDLDALDGGQP